MLHSDLCLIPQYIFYSFQLLKFSELNIEFFNGLRGKCHLIEIENFVFELNRFAFIFSGFLLKVLDIYPVIQTHRIIFFRLLLNSGFNLHSFVLVKVFCALFRCLKIFFAQEATHWRMRLRILCTTDKKNRRYEY